MVPGRVWDQIIWSQTSIMKCLGLDYLVPDAAGDHKLICAIIILHVCWNTIFTKIPCQYDHHSQRPCVSLIQFTNEQYWLPSWSSKQEIDRFTLSSALVLRVHVPAGGSLFGPGHQGGVQAVPLQSVQGPVSWKCFALQLEVMLLLPLLLLRVLHHDGHDT